MSYKNLQHYRHTVHRYLDGIWALGWNKGSTRSSMYSILANKMGLTKEETHVRFFDRAQCKKAIQILKHMYIQLYGKDLEYKKREKIMYYSKKTFKLSVSRDIELHETKEKCVLGWHSISVTVYCRAKNLNVDKQILNYDEVEQMLEESLHGQYLNDRFNENPTLEALSKWICDAIVPCYKVEISDGNMSAIYEEDEK